MNVLVAGGSGFVGKALVHELMEEGHSVCVLSRALASQASSRLEVELWDGKTQGEWAKRIEKADAVVNLSGAGIADKRWSPRRKKEIISSRLDSTKALVEAMANSSRRPKAFVNASAVGYYGDVPQGTVTESHLKGKGFLADTCAEWERQARKAEALGVRVVTTRFGVILGRDGGALKKFIPPFLLFAGGPLGSGRQWFPWVHRDDVVGAILYLLSNEKISGPVNVTAPGTVTMAGFCKELGRAMHRPSWAPVPAPVLKVMLGEMSDMLLTGQQVIPQKLEGSGYHFRFPQPDAALADLFRK